MEENSQPNTPESPTKVETLPTPLKSREELKAKEESHEASKHGILGQAKSLMPFGKKKKEKTTTPEKTAESSSSTESKTKSASQEEKKKGRIKKLEEKFISLKVQRQVYLLLGILLLIAVVLDIPGKIIALLLAVCFLFSGFTGKKFFVTSLMEKAPWNKDINAEFAEELDASEKEEPAPVKEKTEEKNSETKENDSTQSETPNEVPETKESPASSENENPQDKTNNES